METENFAPLDLQKEYYRTLSASRIAATVLLLLSLAWTGGHYLDAQSIEEIYENRVSGGMQSEQPLSGLAFDHGKEALALSCLAAFGGTLFIWVAGRNLPRIILATSAGAGACLVVGLLMQLNIHETVQAIFMHFKR